MPGVSFQCPEKELTARVAYVNFDGAKTVGMSDTIPLDDKLPENFGDNCCASVFEVMPKIADWVNYEK